MSKITVTAASRIGCIRHNNEDMILIGSKFLRSDAYRTELTTEAMDRFTIALADGMGGHNAGEVASAETLANFHFFLNDLPRGLSIDDFHKMSVAWLNSINQIMASKSLTDPSLKDMGTTLVAVVYYEQHYYWVSCGDSRLYRLRGGTLQQLTTDHSYNMLIGQAKHSNILTNCIGAGCQTSYFDFADLTDDMQPGDVYLLCSDGLNDMVADVDIERMMNENATGDQLCEAAIEAGGFDNVSACVFQIE